MTPREQGFLLLTSLLGDPERKPLTVAQFRTLAKRVQGMAAPEEKRMLRPADLMALGYSEGEAGHILHLLSDKELLEYYLHAGRKNGCIPLTRVSEGYPGAVRLALGLDSPGCLWAKGDMGILENPKVALVGSRDIREENRVFAREVGRQAAIQGYTLVSGNARGSDKIAQTAALRHGGRVISVVADRLSGKKPVDGVLYLSEEDYDLEFSTQRALRRNRVIHALGAATLVAQCSLGIGGTWSGTTMNLKAGWSPVFCFRDGSEAVAQLAQMGAEIVGIEALSQLHTLKNTAYTFFDQ